MLYIEDDSSNMRLVERLLKRRQEIGMLVASTAQDGFQAAIDSQPDLILLDNRLPDGTGREVLRRLASEDITAAIPVVIVTGDSDRGSAEELLALGAAEVLTKPYDIQRFLSMIDRLLG